LRDITSVSTVSEIPALKTMSKYLTVEFHLRSWANEAETSLKLFQAGSVFCFSFISWCADVWN